MEGRPPLPAHAWKNNEEDVVIGVQASIGSLQEGDAPLGSPNVKSTSRMALVHRAQASKSFLDALEESNPSFTRAHIKVCCSIPGP